MKVISTAANISQAFKNAGRVREILGVLGKHGFADLLHRMRLTRFLPQKYSNSPGYQQLPVPVRLRLSFEELGPTFVKLGQLLATRPDLIPEEFTEEFERLQDNVAGVPFAEVRSVIESETKSTLEHIFSDFEQTPLAAASIAQVHGGILKTGERVAIKIQRPGIEKIITNDISILRGLAILMEKYLPETQVLNPSGLVEEFFQTILFELDFRVEANNIRRIRKNLAPLPKISVPQVFTQFSTNRVLVLERFDGVRFSDREGIQAQGIDPSEIVRLGTDAFFHMVMVDGLFHGDLHGGNLFVLRDGRIGMVDFGIVGRLSRRVQDSIIIMFTAIIDEDFETLAAEYVNLCQVTGPSDFSLLQKDLMDSISPYIGMALGEVNIGKVLLRSTSIAARHHLKVPRELMLLFRAILTIEALGKRLDPSFDLLPVGINLARQTLATRYSKERVMHDLIVVGRDLQSLLETTPRLLKRSLHKWAQNGFAVETKSKDVEALARSVGQSNYVRLLQVFSLGWFALGITFIVKDLGPEVAGMPVGAIVSIAIALGPLVNGLWRLRKLIK